MRLSLLAMTIACGVSAGEMEGQPIYSGLQKYHFELSDEGLSYGLEFSTKPSDPAEQQRLERTLKEMYKPDPVPMASVVGEQFYCYAPKDEHRVTEVTAEEDGQKMHPSELLEELKDTCMYRFEAYWSYEFCYKKHMRQYHEDVYTDAKGKKNKKLSEHFLGSDTGAASIVSNTNTDTAPRTFQYKGVETPYYSEIMSGGDICDLTGMPRTTEFRYVCDAQKHFSFESIAETETCNYLAIVHTAILCGNPDYGEKEILPKSILCLASVESQDGEEVDAKPSRLVQLEKEMKDELQARIEEEKKMQELIAEQVKKEKLERSFNLNVKQAGKGKRGGSMNTRTGRSSSTASRKSGNKGSKEEDKKHMEKSARQMLNLFLEGKQCFIGGQGWWQHEFCYQKHVKQIHREPDGTTQQILLGVWDPEYHKYRTEKLKGPKKDDAVTLYYKDGDYCEETKSKRRTKVKIICKKSLKGAQVALSLQETRTCSYVMKVESPLFCEAIKNADELGNFMVEK